MPLFTSLCRVRKDMGHLTLVMMMMTEEGTIMLLYNNSHCPIVASGIKRRKVIDMVAGLEADHLTDVGNDNVLFNF